MLSDLEHFLRLARAGNHPACSSGERQACEFARLALGSSLDDSATRGLIDFLWAAKHLPSTARDLLELQT